MADFINFFVLIIIGAFIGGITNSIAIKMLFRPYKAMYLGKFRIPFTPGVIPKRQEEIAKSLGRLVMKHLITADSIEKKLKEERFSKVIIDRVTKEAGKLFASNQTVESILDKVVDSQKLAVRLEGKTTDWLMNEAESLIETYKKQSLYDVLPEDMRRKIDGQLPAVAQILADKTVDYLESNEGRIKVKEQLDSFFEGRGMLGNMLGMFLGNQSIVDKVYPELIKFLQQPSFKQMLHKMLENEWLEVQGKSVNDIAVLLGFNEDRFYKNMSDQVRAHLPYQKLLSAPIDTLAGEWKTDFLDKTIPSLVHSGLGFAAQKANELLKSMEIEDMVTEQVKAFSVQELEQVILIISKREFKMITYLGALLGGLIGLLQGVFLLFMG
ncbi:uncharacterized membrane protein YheB (UPF0754 family) [Scopulibacillus darangshiensis]|uniref:Uncharacterized membrane protein YheB (UPF0754 family) n=1 Tax=Scopulibacillus darangshiensis TaxID=442528 RepID=A0A4R2P3U8_9BACL|nr:DUF445 family protein [Scopulibacillus darangshiensis]TCP29297.1 uncharacterized membrane protein YheB (UPF0754 family) [Scopulibacillus darangshiensis]